MTERYERVMKPTYGASTTRLMFANLDSLEVADYKEETVAKLNRNMSNCVITDLSVTGSSPGGGIVTPDPEATLYVNVQYRLNSSLASSTLSVALVDPSTVNVFTPL
jgi:hypothetical protein